MPVETDADAWREAASTDSLESRVETFLAEHPERAYRLRELADEVLGMEWAEVERKLRDEKELPDEEFFERYPPDEAYPTVLSQMRPTDQLWVAVTRLAREGTVEARDVAAEHVDSPDPEFETTEIVVHYAYSGA